MVYSEMERYWIWLSSVEGIGIKRFYHLIASYGDARAVWEALASGGAAEIGRMVGRQALGKLRQACHNDYMDALFEQLDGLKIRAMTRLSADYPEPLSQIYDPPATLYIRGDCPLSGERMFSIVGSRRCTRDGQRAAMEIAEGLARADVTVVSGMARGIDSHAHEGALNGRGRTIAVLGCGPDVVYPPENADLSARILDEGGAIISEYKPGVQPLPGNFPSRNRIISGLSRGTLLVEGAKGSGAMITVNDALDQGRDVFAVPGSIYSPLSETPNRMIVDGAVPVLSPWEILEYYRWGKRPEVPERDPLKGVKLEPDELVLVTPLREQTLTFDELSELSGFSAAKLNSHLTMLELRGIIIKVPGGMYRAYL